MDNQINPPTDPPSDEFQINVPEKTYCISSLSRKKRKKLRIQLNTDLQRVKAMIRTTNIKAAKMKKPKIEAAKIKTESGSHHQVQNVLPQNLAKLIDQCNDDILKRLRKYPNCKHLNEPVFVEGLVLLEEEPIGLNQIADRFKEKSYKSPFQFADDMRSACNHAIIYDKRDEVVKVASLVLDKVNELIEPILVEWKRLGGVEDEEIWKESTDVEAELGEKSGDIGENGVSDSERGDDAG